MSMAPDPPSDGTGAGLAQFLDHQVKYGRIKSATGGSYKVAVKEVLGATHDDWETADVTTLDVDDITQRFDTLRSMNFSPDSLGTYKSRFRSAVSMYRDFLGASDRSSWRPAIRQTSRSSSNGSARARRDQAPTPVPSQSTPSDSFPDPVLATPSGPMPRMIPYPFPLRDGVLVTLTLPPDLTKREAKRLAGFIDSLAIEEQPALNPGRPELPGG